VPVAAGVDYSLGFEGDATPTSLSFVRLSGAPINLDGIVDALVANRCEAQLDLLIQTMPAAAPVASN
jgi:hypothetical protein